jgi:hypothetical protein
MGLLSNNFGIQILIAALYPSWTKGANNRRADAEKGEKLRKNFLRMKEILKPEREIWQDTSN